MMKPEWGLVPEPWATKLADLPEYSMGVQVVDVTLKDGKVHEGIVIGGGMVDVNSIPFLWSEVVKMEVAPENVGGGLSNFTDIDDTWID